MAAIGCRKALELAIRWVYSADNTMKMPYKNNLQALIHEPSFKFAVEKTTWNKLTYIVKLGNLAVHTEKSVSYGDAVYPYQLFLNLSSGLIIAMEPIIKNASSI